MTGRETLALAQEHARHLRALPADLFRAILLELILDEDSGPEIERISSQIETRSTERAYLAGEYCRRCGEILDRCACDELRDRQRDEDAWHERESRWGREH